VYAHVYTLPMGLMAINLHIVVSLLDNEVPEMYQNLLLKAYKKAYRGPLYATCSVPVRIVNDKQATRKNIKIHTANDRNLGPASLKRKPPPFKDS
jgi:hypothetical protein